MIRPLSARRAHVVATLVTFFVGALLAFTFLLTDASWPVPTIGAALMTAAFAISRMRVRPWARVCAGMVVLGAYSLWTYEFVAFGEALAWTIHPLIWLLVVVLAIGVVLTH
jgi:hypothetical protein